MYSLALDIVLAVLLVATIGYAMVLNKKLGDLRRHKEELERLAATFAESTARAKDSISHLKRSTINLQADTAKAAGLKDDLKYLIDRGSSAADRLEAAIRASRGEDDAGHRHGAAPRQTVETVDDAIAQAGGNAHMRSATNKGNTAGGGIAGDLSSEMEDGDDVRSKAEKELIEALRSVR